MRGADDLLALADGVHRCRLADGRRVHAKIRRGVAPDFFLAEARGLAALARANALRVPEVIAVGANGIVLEDLGAGRPRLHDWERAGIGLATLHGHAAQLFGFDAEGWCGDSPQDNTRDVDGHGFFAQRRLLPQAQRAFDAGLLSRAELQRIEALCGRLVELLPVRPAVLVHGDLWRGNLHACADGGLALIDGGAVHYGWAEGDLAMLTLFGAPPEACFAAYQAAAGIGGDWRERAPLLNLYHLLNHLNLFGAGYLGAVRAVLARYA